MTVREAIAKLESFDPDMDVAIIDADSGLVLSNMEIGTARSKHHDKMFVSLFADYDEDCGTVLLEVENG